MNRRTFLTRSGLALGALIVGDEALEQLARLTHVRKAFPSAGVARLPTLVEYARAARLDRKRMAVVEMFTRRNSYIETLRWSAL